MGISGGNKSVFVEVLVTGAVLVEKAVRRECNETIGRGRSSFTGIPNHKACMACNPPLLCDSIIRLLAKENRPQNQVSFDCSFHITG